MILNRIISGISRNFFTARNARKFTRYTIPLPPRKIHTRTEGYIRTFHTGTDNTGVVQEKSMLLKHPKSINSTINIKKPNPPSEDITTNNVENTEKPPDLIKTLSEQLIADTNSNTHKPTMAENEVDTMDINTQLLDNGFSDIQSQAIMKVMMNILNDEFYLNYNDKYLRDFEIDKQLHLFNSLQSEIKFIIGNSRDSQFNLHHLQITRLKRDLNSDLDDLNEEVIDILEKDRKLDFNNQKVDNTLLYRRINMSLRDCSNKISINILAGIKLEIENLRWHTTRSGLVAIAILVFLILTGVNVSNKKSNKDNEVTDHELKEVVLKTIDPEDIDENTENI
ncbi:similar to Saccharomyces cerevisiae YLR283W Putative protein of unknown function [Maudiozyma saulgeensis]|uniref:DUF1640 domain-containing protein n=1 Tax=Maudiozyma saulgeensis TaxID=1789683 RepID=A0A1X7R6N0_9SACH|nr:similar to Saccharomyces cerevisiae YLR283W Putative protein of unknown function [Kazachstania saulgeensis]